MPVFATSRHRATRRLLAAVALAALCGAGLAAAAVLVVERGLPQIRSFSDYRPPEASQVLADDGTWLATWALERRTVVPIEALPRHLVDAFLAAEDAHFYAHEGIDYLGIVRAAAKNLRPGAHLQGASTITQQIVKTMVLGPERSYGRKVREALLARQLEQMLGKDEILGIYLNQIYFGLGAYGVEEAAQTIFGRAAATLEMGEAALLAAIPKNPARYNVRLDAHAARARQRYVLAQMQAHGWATAAEVTAALAAPLPPPPARPEPLAPHLVAHVRGLLTARLGEAALLEGGLRIYTGIDPAAQRAANEAVAAELPALARRQGVPVAPKDRTDLGGGTGAAAGPIPGAAAGTAAGSGGRAAAATAAASELPEAAVVALEPSTRLVRALVGGRAPAAGYGFNRATQARRQPGSAFKPVVYAAALDARAITAASLCPDAPLPVTDPATGRTWRPENYEDGRYDGNLTYRTALRRSKNTCAVRLLRQIGPAAAVTMAGAMGVESPLPENLTLALGTGEVTPVELANVYATLADAGQYRPPAFVRRVLGRDGRDVAGAACPQVPAVAAIAPGTAYVLTDILADVALGRGPRPAALDRPLAGKTGTAQEGRSLWFAGFSPQLAMAVYVGWDDNRPMPRETGASAARPIWARAMAGALSALPPEPFDAPPDVVRASVDAATGAPCTDGPRCAEEVFLAGTEPGSTVAPLRSIFLEDDDAPDGAPPASHGHAPVPPAGRSTPTRASR